jgi:hypothetical protein
MEANVETKNTELYFFFKEKNRWKNKIPDKAIAHHAKLWLYVRWRVKNFAWENLIRTRICSLYTSR